MKKITIIGSGTMGNGIAHVTALNGYETSIYDLSENQLDKAKLTIEKNLRRQAEKGLIATENVEKTMNRIQFTNQLFDALANCDLVIEAASENLEIKLSIFKELDKKAPSNCILASNTSSISITKLGAATQRPDKVIGMHFMNPVPVMKLVEVIKGYNTSKVVCEGIMDLSKKLGKIPVEVNDYPGFVANRILMPMINESIATLFEGVAGVEEIDQVMKLGMAHPMGPLQLADFIGLDVCLAILKVLQDGFGNPKYAPCPLLINMVQAGHLGVKSGSGFYQYASGNKELVVAERFKM
ncbi:MAG: 3-hydroxybutyryl-CoA dehydrogenase [Cytophagaceae bacterium]|nr:3-hydroxybutyryl-CoA dehydrogenase [Cytophagaceae bacterium]